MSMMSGLGRETPGSASLFWMEGKGTRNSHLRLDDIPMTKEAKVLDETYV